MSNNFSEIESLRRLIRSSETVPAGRAKSLGKVKKKLKSFYSRIVFGCTDSLRDPLREIFFYLSNSRSVIRGRINLLRLRFRSPFPAGTGNCGRISCLLLRS